MRTKSVCVEYLSSHDRETSQIIGSFWLFSCLNLSSEYDYGPILSKQWEILTHTGFPPSPTDRTRQ